MPTCPNCVSHPAWHGEKNVIPPPQTGKKEDPEQSHVAELN